MQRLCSSSSYSYRQTQQAILPPHLPGVYCSYKITRGLIRCADFKISCQQIFVDESSITSMSPYCIPACFVLAIMHVLVNQNKTKCTQSAYCPSPISLCKETGLPPGEAEEVVMIM